MFSRNRCLTGLLLGSPQNWTHWNVLSSFSSTVDKLLEAHPYRLDLSDLLVGVLWQNTEVVFLIWNSVCSRYLMLPFLALLIDPIFLDLSPWEKNSLIGLVFLILFILILWLAIGLSQSQRIYSIGPGPLISWLPEKLFLSSSPCRHWS